MSRTDDEDPGLPIKLEPCSNGEYVAPPASPVVREAIRRAQRDAEDNARRLGLSRRQFLLSVCGAATTLLALDACTKEAARSSTTTTSAPGGTFALPPQSTVDPDAARTTLAGKEFILDVQGHLLDYEINPAARNGPFFGSGFPQVDCGDEDPRSCFSIEHFMEEVFLKSDTSLVVLSALPIPPEESPLTIEVMEETRRVATALCRDDRVLLHGQAVPTLAPLDTMNALVTSHPIAAWKVYTHSPGPGWWLDDHDPGAPQVGGAFIERAIAVGVPTICVHKGFSGGSRYASPEDIGRAAVNHPKANLVVYHSGYEAGEPEGPYEADTADQGVNRLVTALLGSGIGPNANVFAELGSTWRSIMGSPTEAAHVIGKLLRYVGEDNILWGTDSIWYGSPQDQIMAFRAFQITPEFQERFGYPALTSERKAKILGLNAARLYKVKPEAVSCPFSREDLERIRPMLRGGHRTYGPRTRAEVARVVGHHRGLP